jgi:hypothetical protein
VVRLSRYARTACAFTVLLLIGLQPVVGRAEQPPSSAKPALRPTLPATAPSDCAQRLKAMAQFTPLPAMAGPGECGVEDPVKLQAVFMPDGSRVALEPPATLRCTMAEAVTQFVRGEVGPVAASLGAPLAAVVTADAYDCRNRNRMQAAKISEHARGNALDIGALKLANRKSIDLTAHATPEPFRARMREAACRFFTTVLGPGSDGYHNEHIHLDRAERRGGYRMCQWDLNHGALMAVVAAGGPVQQSVPLPPPKPIELRQAQRTNENGAGPEARRRPRQLRR